MAINVFFYAWLGLIVGPLISNYYRGGKNENPEIHH